MTRRPMPCSIARAARAGNCPRSTESPRQKPPLDAVLIHTNRLVMRRRLTKDQLRICDGTVRKIADELPPRAHSSREFRAAMGRFLDEQGHRARGQHRAGGVS